MNYNVMCETDDYGLSNDTKYYANLFKAKTNINNANHYNDCQIIFRVFHISSTSGISMYKDYIFTTCRDKKDIVNLIDLNPHVKKIKIGYNISEEGEVVVLGKGSIIGAKLKIQVLYSPTIGMFEFFNCSSFTNNISCIEASKAEMSDIPDLTNYATKTYVTDEIAKASLSGTVDLSGYAKTVDVNSALSGITGRVSGLENDTATIINEINNLNIGGRNYIKNSIFANGLTHWEQHYSVSSIDTAFLFNNHATLKLSASGFTSDKWSGVSQRVNIDVAEGKTYTLSCYYYVQDLSTFDSALSFEFKTNKGSSNDFSIGNIQVPKNSIIEGKWTKISTTLTINRTDINNPYVYLWLQRNGTAWFTNFKLEEGTIATDWTPAPEDVDESLSNKAEMTDIPDLTNYATKTYVTDEIAKAATSGTVDLTGYAKTADVNSALDTKAEKSTVEDISNSVTSLDTSLSSITGRVSGLENDTATIIHEINNLNIGGRNYIKNSIFANGLTHWEQHYSVSSIDTAFLFNNHATLKLSASGFTSDKWSGVSQRVNIDVAEGKTYTLSCYYYVQDLSTFDSALTFEFKTNKGSSNDVSIGSIKIPKNSIIEGKWTKISTTLTINRTDINNPYVYLWLQRNGTAWFTNFKLEEGTIATDWTPAPEDVDERMKTGIAFSKTQFCTDTSKYAPLFKIARYNGSDFWEVARFVVRIMEMGDTLYKQDEIYIASALVSGKANIYLKNINGTNNLDYFATENENCYTFYVKATTNNSQVVAQVEYSNNIGFLQAVPYEYFDQSRPSSYIAVDGQSH